MTLTAINLNPAVLDQEIDRGITQLVSITAELRRWFDVDFSVWDVESGVVIIAARSAELPGGWLSPA